MKLRLNLNVSKNFQLMKSIKIIDVLFLLVLFQSCGCNPIDAQKGSKEGLYKGIIKVGHMDALDMAPLFVAKENGYFREEGLDIEMVFFGNPRDNTEALSKGRIQFSTNPFTFPYLEANSGEPVQIISAAGGLGVIEVIIQGEYDIQSVEELVQWVKAHPDKKLRISGLKGGLLEMVIRKILKDNALSYDDVEMVWFNERLSMVQSFQLNEVDILSHVKPYTTDMIVNQGAKSLANNSDVWGKGTPNCTVTIMEGFGKQYPGTVMAYLKALRRGFQFIVDHPEEAAELLDKGHYYRVDLDVLKYAFSQQPAEVILEPNAQGMKLAIEAMVELGYIGQPPKQIINLSFLQEVQKEVYQDSADLGEK